MDRILPWKELCAVVRPHYPTGEVGRVPIDLERMLRIHFLQHRFYESAIPRIPKNLNKLNILAALTNLLICKKRPLRHSPA